MAKVVGRALRREGESVLDFKERCCEAMRSVVIDESIHNFVGRFAAIGRGLADCSHSFLWGQAFPELPSDECLVIAYAGLRMRGLASESRASVMHFDPADLLTAQVFD